VIPWVHLDSTTLPDGGEMKLARRGDEFSIRLGGNELMNSRLSGSEEALATLACAKLSRRPALRVLIGGLGMGFTLRAALPLLPADAQVVVAELLPAVADWARGPMAPLYGACLDDPRVRVEVQDVARLMGAGAASRPWDGILLDVDNGPDGLTQAANDGLYGAAGLAAARRALGAGGVLAVWSEKPGDAFAKRFARAGFAVEDHRVHAHRGKSGRRHVVWVGVKSQTVFSGA
jgi:spermidine synthase